MNKEGILLTAHSSSPDDGLRFQRSILDAAKALSLGSGRIREAIFVLFAFGSAAAKYSREDQRQGRKGQLHGGGVAACSFPANVKLTMEIVRGERDVVMTVCGRVSEGFAFRESSMELAIYTKE